MIAPPLPVRTLPLIFLPPPTGLPTIAAELAKIQLGLIDWIRTPLVPAIFHDGFVTAAALLAATGHR